MSKTAKKPAKKKAAKKPAAKKAPAKRSAVKKKIKKTGKIKKAAPKKAVKKTVVKKTSRTVSVAVPKKKVVKKAPVKKATVKKIAIKKTVVKKTPAKKIVAKQPVAEKTEITVARPETSPVKAEVVKKLAAKKAMRLPGGIVAKAPVVKNISTNSQSRPALINAILEGLEERKAKNIVVLDLFKINNRSFDYFVIADADSSTHVESIASSVEEEVKKKTGERPYHSEGWQNAEWILLDYVNVVVHVFQKPIRDFYNIEDLWADAEMQKIN